MVFQANHETLSDHGKASFRMEMTLKGLELFFMDSSTSCAVVDLSLISLCSVVFGSESEGDFGEDRFALNGKVVVLVCVVDRLPNCD
jgi:hypothetical protein